MSQSSNSQDGSSSGSGPWIKFYAFVIGSLAVLVFAFYLGGARERSNSLSRFDNLSPQSAVVSKKLELKVHWLGTPDTINKFNGAEGDVCTILSDCFKSDYFKPDPIKYPNNPLQPCHNTLKSIYSAFDSGFYFDGPRVVGFLSSDTRKGNGFASVNLFNVCVRREDRGKGIAKSMLPEYIKAVTDMHVTAGTKVYVGLDVDFDTESAVAAFSLYAKMGFNRWWEPCPSIYNFDYKVIEKQLMMANPEIEPNTNPYHNQRPAFLFPMSQLFLRRKDTLQKQIRDSQGKVFNHFCMVMLLGADDFGKIGSDIRDSVKEALKSK